MDLFPEYKKVEKLLCELEDKRESLLKEMRKKFDETVENLPEEEQLFLSDCLTYGSTTFDDVYEDVVNGRWMTNPERLRQLG